MKPGEPILLLCHSFPPVPGIGGRRWAKFAKELARRGHPVHVIRSENKAGARESLWAEDVRHPNIIHHPIPARFPEVIKRWPLTTLWDKLSYRAWLRILRLRTKGNYYDAACLSRNDVLREASRLIHAHGIRHVIATGAPFHLLGYAAALKHAKPTLHLTVDFRDEWTWANRYGIGLLSRKRQETERHMEHRVLHIADRVISPHENVLSHLTDKYELDRSRTAWIPHTVDPEDFSAIRHQGENEGFHMVYAGNIYGQYEAEQYFDSILKSLHIIRIRSQDFFNKFTFDLYITGQNTEPFEQMVKTYGMEQHVRFHAPLPAPAVFQILANADLAPVFLPMDKSDVWPTKLNEIAYIGCPILYTGSVGIVSRIIEKNKMGITVPIEELHLELPRIICGERKIEIDPNADHSAYLLGPVTDRLLNEVLV